MTKFRLFFLTSLLAGFSLTFSSCSKDDDDDNDKKKTEINGDGENNQKDENNESGNDQKEVSNAKLVGSWSIDKASCSEKVYFNGHDLGEGTEDPDDPATEDDNTFGSNLIFNEDGTCIMGDEKGSYKLLEGDQMMASTTVDGKTVTLQKGDLDEATIQAIVGKAVDMEGLPVIYKSSKIENFQAIVNGDELTMKLTMTTVMDLSGLQNVTGENSFEAQMMLMMYQSVGDISNLSIKIETTDVYNRVK